jgi:hypothetical protein
MRHMPLHLAAEQQEKIDMEGIQAIYLSIFLI